MGKQSRTATARAAAVAAGVLLIGSTWTGAALADAPIVSGPEVPVPVTTTTSSPVPAGSVAATRAPAAAPVATAGDKDCRDFVSQSAAQAYFTAIGGSATNNADDLDANHNGIACEDYNYGTAAAAGAAGVAGVAGTSSTAASASTDKNCRDFASQGAAQAYFTAIGGSATNNADDLDANHNNIACEDYNYGTSGGASIAGASGASGQSPAAGPAQVSTVPSGGVNTGDGSFVQ